jgi:hypothetical protein
MRGFIDLFGLGWFGSGLYGWMAFWLHGGRALGYRV